MTKILPGNLWEIIPGAMVAMCFRLAGRINRGSEPDQDGVASPAISGIVMLRHPLAREVAIVVAIKAAIVIAAAIFVFGPKQRPVVNAAAVEALIVSPPATIPEVRSDADE